ncbi:MAG: TAXI family TRAP transporter solute-binding subunit [Ruminococcaceae bacterium]|nr:TAXI family TRAP transporter solute-binding subunit [Oscillospiraceae bacterium]
MKKILAVCLAVLMLAGAMTSCGSKMFMATGSETGTYYAFGIVLADEIKNAAGIEIGVQSSGASKANIQLIDDETVDFAIVQNDVMDYAYNGTNTFAADGAITSFAAIATMYAEVVQIVASPDITSVADLVGKRVSVGDVGSGTEFNAQQIFEAYGMTFDDIQKQNLGFTDSADKFKDGQLDAFFLTAGAPTVAVTELATAKDFNILSIGETEMAYLKEHYGYYTEYTIGADEYTPNGEPMDSDAVTVAVMATLICDSDLDEDTVYNVTKAIYENIPAITTGHKKGEELNAQTACDGISIPMHPGAVKYFTEIGTIAE